MKQENRSSKTLKGQLLGAISMMLVAAIALGTSTYAWFINNQAVTVEAMTMEVSASTSMMVAVGKDGATKNGAVESWTGFKTTIINKDITGLEPGANTDVADWTDMFKNPLSPASITTASLDTAAAQTSATVAPAFFASKDTTVAGKLTEFDALAVEAAAANIGQGVVKRIPLRFMSSKAIDVYFGDTTGTLTANGAPGGTPDIAKMIADPAAEKNGVLPAEQGNGIRAALRIAVVPHSSTNQTANTPSIFQFDAGAPLYGVASGNNTGYPAAEQTPTTPNEATGLYRGIQTLTSTAIATTGALQAKIPTDGAKCIAGYADGKFTAPANGTPLFKLSANEPRDVDVYIWLDGTDQDCISTLSQFGFKLNMPFAAVVPTA